MFTSEKKAEIVKILDERLRRLKHDIKCPMCSNNHFIIADAYLRNELQSDLRNLTLGGPSIPAIAIICKNCGFISQHAAGPLDILEQEETKDGKN